jgi:hypothetical protein
MRVCIKELLISFAVGGVAGGIYDSLSWAYHLPYVGLNWLAPLLRADGERGYDVMFYESVIDFGLIALLLYLLGSVIRRAVKASGTKSSRDGSSDR